MSDHRPLIAHIIYRLDFGGLENGLVNLINTMPADKYRHAIICLDTFTDFRRRIQRDDVEVIALHKKPGKDLHLYVRLWKALRKLQPTITHSRNLAALDANLPSWLAGVPVRIHGEHGRDIIDIDGSNKKYQRLRRVMSVFINRFVPLSIDLQNWLADEVKIPAKKIRRVCNGVDVAKFSPNHLHAKDLIEDWPFEPNMIVIGAVGRMHPVKDPLNLIEAFILLLQEHPEYTQKVRLMMAGDGELRQAALERLADAGFADYAWLPGARNDVPQWLKATDIYVLPSLAEGISNTLLESMASGVSAIATNVGGNSELIKHAETGYLVPAADSAALAQAIARYVADDTLRSTHAGAARQRCEREFSIDAMINKYLAVYDECTGKS